MNVVIATAIRQRHTLQFTYDGEDRVAEPYCLGVTKDNRWLLRAWQTSGDAHWRLFDPAEMGSLRDTGKVFRPSRAGYNANDPAMQSVYAHI